MNSIDSSIFGCARTYYFRCSTKSGAVNNDPIPNLILLETEKNQLKETLEDESGSEVQQYGRSEPQAGGAGSTSNTAA